jgi:hypothetical protein
VISSAVGPSSRVFLHTLIIAIMARFFAVTAILLSTGNAVAQVMSAFSYLVPDQPNYLFPDETGVVGVGSIIGANSAGTTVAGGCGKGTSTSICEFSQPATFTIGPSLFRYTVTDTSTFAISCSFVGASGASTAICSTKAWESGTTETDTETINDLFYQTVLVTAGANKLYSTAAGETTTDTPAATSRHSNAVPSVTTTPSEASSSSSGTDSTPSPHNAGARMCPTKGGIVAAFLLWYIFG